MENTDIVDVKQIYEIGEDLKKKLTDKKLFSGEKLVDLFIQSYTQINTRDEAVKLGKHFIEYRIMQHDNDKYTFMDDSTKKYMFCCHSEMIFPRSASERQTWVQGIEVMKQFTSDTSLKKRKNSLFNMLSNQNNNNATFKGKTLLDWLEKNTDFESREDCRRFIKALLKLYFLRNSNNDILYKDNTQYYFYITSIKGDAISTTAKIRKLSNAMKGDVPNKSSSLERKPSMVGLTSSLMNELNNHQPRRDTATKKMKLKSTCEVLRGSITSSSRSRNNLSCSTTGADSFMSSIENLTGSRGNLAASRGNLVCSRGNLAGSRDNLFSSRNNLAGCNTPTLSQDKRSCSRKSSGSGSEDNSQGTATCSQYVNRLKEQNLTPMKPGTILSTLSSSEYDLLDLIKSEEFQSKLKNIGKSASQNNRHVRSKAEQDRRDILKVLQQSRQYGARQSPGVISPSNSCPHDLNTLLKRDWSIETNVTRSSGYGSTKDRSRTSTSSSGHEEAASSRTRYISTSSTKSCSSSCSSTSPKIMSGSTPPSESSSPIAKIRSKLTQELHLKRSIQSTLMAMTERTSVVSVTDRRRARLVRSRAVTTDN